MSVIFFFENNAGKEKRSVEYCLFINEFCHNEGGRIPSTSEPTSLVKGYEDYEVVTCKVRHASLQCAH